MGGCKRTLLCGVMGLLACGGGSKDSEPAPEWSQSPPLSEAVGERRGWIPKRTIVHLHSPYSHDACDGAPREDETGPINEDCLTDLRQGLCDARIDVAALTDHDDSMADETWGPSLFLYREGDELITVGDQPVGNWMTCASGHRTLIRIGSENALMPVFMERHPEGETAARKDIYNGTDSVAVEALRNAGGTIWVAHTEERDIDWLRDLGVDGFEWFNIHAAIAPDIRQEHLGLDGAAAVEAALEFNVPTDNMPVPDLAGLAIMFTNEPADRKWTTLLSEGRRIAITAGTDAHQNVLPILMQDGERADSYRRQIRWASNFILVDDENDVMAPERALADGRSFLAFELFGTPQGFDFRVETDAGTVELGGETTTAAATTVIVDSPVVAELSPLLEPPTIETILYRVDADGRTEVARGPGTLTLDRPAAGAYHVQVKITPKHLLPYLGTLPDYADGTYTWVQSNAIYVRD